MEPNSSPAPRIATALEQLRRLEPIFHRPEYSTPAALEQLVAPDFWEIGASGRRYSRPVRVADARRARAGQRDRGLSGRRATFTAAASAPNVYLPTYTLLQGERPHASRHALATRPRGLENTVPSGHRAVEDEDQES